MTSPVRVPYPDVPRLVGKVRGTGDYAVPHPSGVLSPIGRFGTTGLWRAWEYLVHEMGAELRDAMATALTELARTDADELRVRFRDLGQGLQPAIRRGDNGIGAFVDPRLPAAERMATIHQIRRAGNALAAVGDGVPLTAELRDRAASLLYVLRNAAVHQGVMTTDDVAAAPYPAACALLDWIIEDTYCRFTQLAEEEFDAAAERLGTEGTLKF